MTPPATPSQDDGDTGMIGASIEHLERGGLLIHPTETVYGVGGLLRGPATHRLRELKDRQEDGFVVLIPDRTTIDDLLSAAGDALVDAFWPGPLTVVLDDPEHRFPPLVKAKDGSVAVRVCGHPFTQRLLATLGEPMTSTSANPPGGTAPRTYADAIRFVESARRADPTVVGIDRGTLMGGPPSTLVDARDDAITVLRPGQVTDEELRNAATPKQSARERG